jgi:oligopeptide transport system substrate-binding protein
MRHPRKSPRHLFPALILLGLALLLPSCSRHGTLVERGDREQVLHRGIGHELADLDPQLATMASDYSVLSALFEGLVAEDPVDLHPVPGVAERWTVSDDGTLHTFHLRTNARWSDGRALTAQDFIDSYRRILSPALGADNATQLELIRGARAFHRGQEKDFSTVGLEAPDDHTLRITLEHATPWFLSLLSQPAWYPVPLHAISAVGPATQRGNRWARPGSLVGNGPFVLREWSVNHRIVVERSETYWDRPSVRLCGIHFYPIETEVEERAFRAGQLHLTEALPPGRSQHYQGLKPSPLRIDPLLGTYFYRLNLRAPGLDDPRIRQALSLAVGRREICRGILAGLQSPASSFTPAGIPGYAPPAPAVDDPARARALLAEAGHPGGSGLPVLELLYNSSETHRLIAEAVQENWRRELGVHVRLSNMDNASVLAARRSGNFQILRSSWTGDFVDAQNFLEVWSAESANNFTGWSDAAYDALLREAGSCRDQVRRAALLGEAEQRLLAASPVIPVYHYAHAYLIRPSVKGWHSTLLDHHPYKHVWLEP